MFISARHVRHTPVLALVLACLLAQPAAGQFKVPGAGAEEKKGGFFTLDKATINYWQFEPKKAKGPLPAILVFHGIEGLDGFANQGGMANAWSPAARAACCACGT